ncbi:hypothetical protein JAAARDRAFT_206672 [Jaapia argillacea MUCL 33604]|uniref:NmrA-like domain-containing protein n=1 Tax=Jaapia argillacea MUCL 33604 TaxID=933084 RepID=A0A067PT02_9AGAM|nr:hypothetical protein JAAARDRAFT_206672 [Jaapia argillacea MUCL 33604]
MTSQTPTTYRIFFLGATGYLGSEVLILLGRKYPQHRIVALIRPASVSRAAQLHNLHPNVTIVEGTLDDDDVIQEEASKADIVIGTAHSDHLPSVQTILGGLKLAATARPGNPPTYVHISGLGIVSDNVRGEPVESVKEWTDIGLDLKALPPTNFHLPSDLLILEAGTRKECPIRTLIIFPGQIYGAGQGMQKVTPWFRTLLGMSIKVGFAGTWGPGANAMNNIHVRDCAMAILTIFEAALDGRAEEGAEGLYFACSTQKVSHHEWTKVMGDILYAKGLLKQGGAHAFPSEILDPLGDYGWSLIGGNALGKSERLAPLGWEPVETTKMSMMEYLPVGIDTVLHEMQLA